MHSRRLPTRPECDLRQIKEIAIDLRQSAGMAHSYRDYGGIMLGVTP